MGGQSGAPAAPKLLPGSTMMRQGGPSMAPSMYAQPQPGVSPLIAALRGNTPQRQMNSGVMFMPNQQNAPTTPMTSYLRGQQMAQQIAQQANQPTPARMPPQQPSGLGVKGLAGPVPQQSITPPSLSASGLTFNPQKSSMPVAPPTPVVPQVTATKAAPKTATQILNAQSADSGDGLLAAITRQRAMQEQFAANNASPVAAPVQQPIVQAPVLPVPPVVPRAVPIAPPPTVARAPITNPLTKKHITFDHLA